MELGYEELNSPNQNVSKNTIMFANQSDAVSKLAAIGLCKVARVCVQGQSRWVWREDTVDAIRLGFDDEGKNALDWT
ncbi:hypothetical protein HDU97_003744 [Phlyctochytrium planicorne]|nr:hypothetical protein HDU97_003744 [Phlyctochytrium planicorne]